MLVTIQLVDLLSKVKEHETSFNHHFEHNASFGIKFFYLIDCCLQLFFASCANKTDIVDVDFGVLDLLHIIRSMTHQQFFCTLLSLFHFKKQGNANSSSSEAPNKKKKGSKCMTVASGIALLSFRLNFGGSFCPFNWCVLIEIITDLANDLLRCKGWDPNVLNSLHAETKRKLTPSLLDDSIPITKAKEADVIVPSHPGGNL